VSGRQRSSTSSPRPAKQARYTDPCDEQIINHLLAALLGAQITASLLPNLETTQTLLTQLDGYLDSPNPPL
jgi:hypothetical protein